MRMSQISANLDKSLTRTELQSSLAAQSKNEILTISNVSQDFQPLLDKHRLTITQINQKSPDGAIPEPMSVRGGEKPKLRSPLATMSRVSSREISRAQLSDCTSVEIKSKHFKSLAQPKKRLGVVK